MIEKTKVESLIKEAITELFHAARPIDLITVSCILMSNQGNYCYVKIFIEDDVEKDIVIVVVKARSWVCTLRGTANLIERLIDQNEDFAVNNERARIY